MKKNCLFAVVFGAAVLAGCSQDEQLDMVQENRLGFTGVLESSESRTTLGDDNKVNWVANEDQVSIFEKDDQNTQYKVKSVSDGVAQFEFIDYKEKDNPVTLDANYAVYPYSDNNSISADGVISVTIPSKIENYSSKDDAIKQALMVAKSTTTDLKFSNAQGILLLRLNAQKPNNYGAIKSIKLTSAKYKLAGTATMSWANNVEKPEAKIDENGTSELTITLASALQTALPKSADGEYVEYYIPVVPTTFEKNQDGTGDVTMTITFEKGDYEKNIGIEFTVGRNKIKPLKHTVGTQNFTGTTEGTESVWDGETLTAMTPVNGVYSVTKPSELAWLASQGVLTSNNGTAESVTIELMNNLDMGNKNLSALIAQRGDALIFKGNGNTISNINIISGAGDNTTGQASMFYAFPNSNLTVSDLTLENITVTADANDSGYAAAVVGYCEGAATLDNVDVVNATVTGVKSSGMLVGHLSGSITAEGCDLSGTITLNEYEQGGHYAGEYIGTIAGTATLTNCNANVAVSGNLNAANVGDMYGRKVSGSLIIDGATIARASSQSELSNAISSGANVAITLSDGEYTVPTNLTEGQVVTIIGNKDTKINITNGIVYPSGSAVTMNFEGVTINGSGYTNGLANTTATYTNCTFNTADMYLYRSAKFIGCTFNDTETYALWTWGAGTVEFEGCTFNTTGKALYVNANVLDNGTNHQTVKITNCKFYDTGTNDTQKAAIETGDDYNCHSYDIFITNITVEGFAVTEDKTSSFNYGGSDFGTNVWGNKYLMGTDKLNVVIDGIDVY